MFKKCNGNVSAVLNVKELRDAAFKLKSRAVKSNQSTADVKIDDK